MPRLKGYGRRLTKKERKERKDLRYREQAKTNSTIPVPVTDQPHVMWNHGDGIEGMYVAFIICGDSFRTKVGVSKNIPERLIGLSTASAFQIHLYCTYNDDDLAHLPNRKELERCTWLSDNPEGYFEHKNAYRYLEKFIKKKFESHRSHKGVTEWFNLHPSEIDDAVQELVRETINIREKELEESQASPFMFGVPA